ncbi:MAG TPA: hypothetical protein VEB68_00720 [Croceibacterium sp.]|nr:hypothetical protein [Croceibacterium sp.]
MNGKILMGLGLAVIVWGVVAAFNDQFILAGVLAIAGLGAIAYGARTQKGAE